MRCRADIEAESLFECMCITKVGKVLGSILGHCILRGTDPRHDGRSGSVGPPMQAVAPSTRFCLFLSPSGRRPASDQYSV